MVSRVENAFAKLPPERLVIELTRIDISDYRLA